MRFTDRIDVDELKELCEDFSTLTGAALEVIDLEANIIISTGWQDICNGFHQIHPETAFRCEESKRLLSTKWNNGRIDKCKNGMSVVTIPIIVGKDHIGNFLIGQFFFKPPAKEYFIQQARNYGFDKNAYLDALSKVPVFSENQVETMVSYIFRLAHLTDEKYFSRNRTKEFNDMLWERNERLCASEANYRTIFNVSNDGIIIYDVMSGHIIDMNGKACEITGYSHTEINLSLKANAKGKFPHSINEFLPYLAEIGTGETKVFEWKLQHKGGRHVWVEVNLKVSAVGEKERVVAVLRDISQQKNAEKELRKSKSSNAAFINAIPDSMFIIRRDGMLLDYKPGKEQLFVSHEMFVGRSVYEIFPPKLAVQTMGAIEITLATGEVETFEYQLPVSDQVMHYEARVAVSGEDEVLAICRNITEKKQMEERVNYLRLYDGLTNLYNRAFFEEEMKRLQSMDAGPRGVLVCDTDGLKVINDTLGHDIGDIILQSVAQILASCFQNGDVVSRIGGDEFAVILSSTSVKKFADCQQRIRESVDRYNAENPTVPISLSMGYAASEKDSDINALYKEAENNMCREKLLQQKSVRSAIVQALMKALEARDFMTEGHGERLQELIQRFAEAVGLPDSANADLQLFAHFHDIGKVGIPDSILFKPGNLREEEWQVMRKHCEIGHRIAMSTPDLAPIGQFILKHHEWWNGSGYPLGLKGKDIPLQCRMLSIIDAYDAMTCDRPYRRAMDRMTALSELKRCAGTQFDPELVEIFCQLQYETCDGELAAV